MLVELILLSGLGASAAGIAYLHHHSHSRKEGRPKRRDEEEARFQTSLLNKLARHGQRLFVCGGSAEMQHSR